MLFTDIIFPVFLTVVFALYWFPLRRHTAWQNLLLLAASYTFYGWWDWRFLGLIVATSATTFGTALAASRSRCPRVWISANIVFNVGILLLFKYFNFFSENLGRLFGLFGVGLDWFTVDVLLPVGISFYTFQAISYSVDVLKKKIVPTTDPVAFFTYIAYFPQLVAGPIERATQLLPQITGQRKWDTAYAVTGLRMILFGVVKKVCVADMLAIYVDRLYAHGPETPWATVAAGLLFTLEIYCDFSAYSEIARGTSRLLGIELMANFRFPYFSRNPLEFWQRWHISLMHWMRDYIYIPLGGNRLGSTRTALNTAAVFLLSGLWHGAGWNFILWGAFWAVCYLAARKICRRRDVSEPIDISSLPSIIATMGIVTFSFYLFRCNTFTQVAAGFRHLWAFALLFGVLWALAHGVARIPSGRIPRCFPAVVISVAVAAAAAAVMTGRGFFILKMWWLIPGAAILVEEWHSRNLSYPLQNPPRCPFVRLFLYWSYIAMVILSEPTDMAFIYFQF